MKYSSIRIIFHLVTKIISYYQNEMPLLILIGDSIMILDYIQVHFVPKNNSVCEREINHKYAHRGIFFIVVARSLPRKHHVIYQPAK